jgi:hypothetical protein
VYRDLGPKERSLNRTTVVHYSLDLEPKRKVLNRKARAKLVQITSWSSRYAWVDRAPRLRPASRFGAHFDGRRGNRGDVGTPCSRRHGHGREGCRTAPDDQRRLPTPSQVARFIETGVKLDGCRAASLRTCPQMASRGPKVDSPHHSPSRRGRRIPEDSQLARSTLPQRVGRSVCFSLAELESPQGCLEANATTIAIDTQGVQGCDSAGSANVRSGRPDELRRGRCDCLQSLPR